MNAKLRWGLATLVSVGVAVATIWFVVPKDAPVPVQQTARAEAAVKSDDAPVPAQETGRAEESEASRDPAVPAPQAARAEDVIKLLVAYSRPLLKYTTQSDQAALMQILFESELRTPGGKRIEIERVGMSSREMVEGVLSGSLKAHVIIPSSEVYLDLADREWTLRTGKPLTSEQVTFLQQPYVLAVRRPMAEALGWPKKDVGWADVVEVARSGWQAVGHPEWGPLRLVLSNPNFADSGVNSVVSIAFGILQKSKGVSAEELSGPVHAAAIKALDNAVVWYPSSIEEFVRNEVLGVPPRCHMTVVPEHVMLTLNDRSARRKAPPDWVAIYPAKGTILDNITGAVVQREWVTQEQREAAAMALKLLKGPGVQKRLMATGHRPVLPNLALTAPFTEAMGLDPKRPKDRIEMPPVEVILDCLSAWNNEWKSRNTEAAGTASSAITLSAAPSSLKKHANLSPTVQCVHRAKPSTVAIKHSDTKAVRGTGVIIDARGYAITNSHVVGKDKTVAVSLLDKDDKVHKGEVVFVDPNQDLAIVRIVTPGKYPAINYSDSSEREVGETVIAIGNPLGYTGTVTVGIISALDRDITGPSGVVLPKLIQTDAGINPGNSGGPLLDIDGNLVGIVFAVRSGAQNIAFCIPADRVHAYVKKCLAK